MTCANCRSESMVIDTVGALTARALVAACGCRGGGRIGLLTVRAGAPSLFGNVDVGTVVAVVLWFNFAAGHADCAAVFG